MIVNAAGVFAERVEALAGNQEESQVHVKPAKGIHLTIPRSALQMYGRTAVVLCDVPANSVAVGVPAQVRPRRPAGKPEF